MKFYFKGEGISRCQEIEILLWYECWKSILEFPFKCLKKKIEYVHVHVQNELARERYTKWEIKLNEEWRRKIT